MGGVFISYRRDDSQGSAGRLYDDLRDRLGKDLVYRDIDTIEPGVDYTAEIVKTIEDCDALVAVIGRTWIGSKDHAENRRLDSAADLVRIEIASALEGGKVVIPVLVEDAVMPSEAELPEQLVPLASRNALPISDLRWDYDVGRLVVRLEKLLKSSTVAVSASSPVGPSAPPPDTRVVRSVRSNAGIALGGAVAGILLLFLFQTVVLGRDTTETGTRGATTTLGTDTTTHVSVVGGSTVTSSVPGGPSGPTDLAVPGPIQMGGSTYTILSARLSRYSDTQSSLTLALQVRSSATGYGYLYGGELRVDVAGMRLAPTVDSIKRAAPNSTEQANFVFVVPSAASSVDLIFIDGETRQTVPFSLKKS